MSLRNKYTTLFVVLLLVMTSVFWHARLAYGVTRTWDGGGEDGTCGGVGTAANWSCAANWSGDIAPGSSDIASFDGTCVTNCSPTINASISVLGIDIQAGYTGTITQANGVTVTVASSDWLQAGGTFVGGNSTIDINGEFILSGGTFTSTTGTLILDGFADVGSLTFFSTVGGTFNHASGTVDFSPSGSGADYVADVDTTLDLYNVIFSSDGNDNTSIAAGDTIIAHNNFTYTIGQLASGGILEVKQDISIASTVDGGSMLVKMTGTGDQDVTGSGGSAYPFNLEVDKPSGVVNVSGNVLIRSLTLTAADEFVSTSGILELSYDWINTAGVPFTHSSGTVIFEDNIGSPSINVASTETFYNLTKTGGGSVHTIASGDTLIALNNFTFTDGVINGGTIEARNAVVFDPTADGGTTVVQFLVGGNQTITGGASLNGGLPLVVNKASGTLSMFGYVQVYGITITSGTVISTSDTLQIDTNWTHTAGGTFEHNNGTVVFDLAGSIDVMGTENFYNLTKTNPGDVHTISSGDTLAVYGTFTHNDSALNGGTLASYGNVVVQAGADAGSTLLLFSGTSTQTYTDQGGNDLDGDITINKASGSVILQSNADWNASNQDLTITSGTLMQPGTYSLATAAVTVATSGAWYATGSGTTTLGGNLVNNGLIDFRGNNTCGGPDSLVLKSSVNGTPRSWSGSGTTVMYDVNVRDQAGTLPVTLYSSTNTSGNGANWTFSAAQCPFLQPVLRINTNLLRIGNGQVNVQ